MYRRLTPAGREARAAGFKLVLVMALLGVPVVAAVIAGAETVVAASIVAGTAGSIILVRLARTEFGKRVTAAVRLLFFCGVLGAAAYASYRVWPAFKRWSATHDVETDTRQVAEVENLSREMTGTISVPAKGRSARIVVPTGMKVNTICERPLRVYTERGYQGEDRPNAPVRLARIEWIEFESMEGSAVVHWRIYKERRGPNPFYPDRNR